MKIDACKGVGKYFGIAECVDFSQDSILQMNNESGDLN